MINRRKFLGLAGVVLASALTHSVALGEEKEKRPRWMRSLVDEKHRREFDNPYEDTVYYIRLMKMRTDNSENDAHGKTHDINSWIRNYYSEKNVLGTTANGEVIFEKFNGFYLLNGDFCLLKEPNIALKQARQFVPRLTTTSASYQLYLVTQADAFNDRPLYILDELTAYINGAIYVGKFGGDSFSNVLDFITYSVSLGIAVKAEDSKYWKSKDGEDLKDFLKYATKRAFYAEASQSRSQPPHSEVIKRFNSMLDKTQSDFLRQELGWI